MEMRCLWGLVVRGERSDSDLLGSWTSRRRRGRECVRVHAYLGSLLPQAAKLEIARLRLQTVTDAERWAWFCR